MKQTEMNPISCALDKGANNLTYKLFRVINWYFRKRNPQLVKLMGEVGQSVTELGDKTQGYGQYLNKVAVYFGQIDPELEGSFLVVHIRPTVEGNNLSSRCGHIDQYGSWKAWTNEAGVKTSFAITRNREEITKALQIAAVSSKQEIQAAAENRLKEKERSERETIPATFSHS